MGITGVSFMLGGLSSLSDEQRVSSLIAYSVGSNFLSSLAKIGRQKNMLRVSQFIRLYIIAEK
jgi:hypothetical protein